MNISLVMVSADGTVKDLPAMHLPITIGRGEDTKLRIPLAAVSRKHCELLLVDDELMVRDLGSSNGTFVNRDRVKERELIPGDLLSVGPLVFVVKIDGYPKIVDPVISYANGSVSPEDIAAANAPGKDGVPTWSGTRSGSKAGSSSGSSSGMDMKRGAEAPATPKFKSAPAPMPAPAPAKPASAPAKAMPPKPASSKPPKDDDSGSFESLLADLSESDFDDIDLGADSASTPKKKKP